MTTAHAIRLGLGWVGLGWVPHCHGWHSAELKAESFPNVTPAGFSSMVPCETTWCNVQVEEAMRPDRVEVSWDAAKSKWLVRIESGEEVIRRHCDSPKNADDQILRAAVQGTVEDEGYELDATSISIRR